MFKSFLVGFLLFNYCLVVVVTNIATVNAVKYTHVYSAVKPYVHAPDCQQRFYLQFDCFDTCNNTAQLDTPTTPSSAYLLLSTIGLDFHFAWPEPANDLISIQSLLLLPATTQAPVAGFASLIDPPPLGFITA
ncbi:hypothetical protein [Adhaeribacter pallidiroseus]|uniref:Uncharacterized protein n=1 Tax=Adhaeribacter pallidiroseus TaxID=2072847 RepID=A0A369QLC4_9BACT|nr:hypothetical protein [Adhaeribacter pallidiroseus]RDC64047.1 hypothetical protein AHMF7616_02657 [Adhaeribacter pallidiroseus]